MSANQEALPAGTRILHLLTLGSLAFAQPLFDLLGRTPELFVIRRICAGEVVLLAVLLLALLPLPSIGASLLGRWLGGWADRWLHGGALGLLGALVALTLLRPASSLPPWVAVGSAGGVGLLLALLHDRRPAMRHFLTFLAPALVVVPALFFLRVPWALLGDAEVEGQALRVASGAARPPVVFLIFDELSLASLLTPDRELDRHAYPNLARLADRSTWYRDTITVADTTEHAVPAILTGRYPQRDRLPHVAEHPRNLFTLLGGAYDIHAEEPVTRLCPASLCEEREALPPATQRFAALVADLGVVYLHLLLPERWTDRLPSVSHGWEGFAARGNAELVEAAEIGEIGRGEEAQGDFVEVALAAQRQDRVAQHERFLAALGDAGEGRLFFLHSMLTHVPWEYLPNGQRYATDPNRIAGLRRESWLADEPWLVVQGEQRYRLQLRYWDRLLGELLDRMEAVGVLDAALIVLTSDHGAAFEPGGQRRLLDGGNLGEVLPVPFFLKQPGQREGRVVDTPLTTADILPSLLVALGLEPPGELDGRPAAQVEAAPDAGHRRARAKHGGWTEVAAGELEAQLRRALARGEERFGSGADPLGLFRAGPYPELVGTPLDALPARPARGWEATVDGEELFADLRPDASVSPACIQGQMSGGPGGAECCVLAIAVDGTIWATTHTHRETPGRFSACLPPQVLTAGARRLEVARVAATPAGPALERRAPAARERFHLVARGESWAVLRGAAEIPIVPTALEGWIDATEIEGGMLRVSGWAVDLKAGLPAEKIAVFLGARLLYSGRPSRGRADVAQHFGEPAMTPCGFSFLLPEPGAEELEEIERDGVRVVAISPRGVASELPVGYRLVEIPVEVAAAAWREELWLSNGARIPLRPERVAGFVEARGSRGGRLRLSGWASDGAAGPEQLEIFVFEDGRLLTRALTTYERVDVAAALNLPPTHFPGFVVEVPASQVKGAGENLAVVAMAGRRAGALLRDLTAPAAL